MRKKTTIILTNSIYTDLLNGTEPNIDRIRYINTVKQWIHRIDFNIVVLDNKGDSFPELDEYKGCRDRFEVLTFTQSELVEAAYLNHKDAKSENELFSIHWAYYNSNIIRYSRFVIKISIPYFIDGFEEYLSQHDLDTLDALVQHDENKHDIVGCHINRFHIVFNKYAIIREYIYSFDIGYVYKCRTRELFKNVLVCKKFDAEYRTEGKNNHVAIILTATAVVQDKEFLAQTDKQARIDTYLKSVKQWLEKTTFNIVLLDNNGYSFPELDEYKTQYADRFEVLSFLESEQLESLHLINDKHKGTSEIFAVDWSFYNSRLVSKSRFVIKVTGRYFIEEFQDYLSQYDLEQYDALCQNETIRCEIIGVHIDKFHMIFNKWPIDANFMYCGSTELVYQYRTQNLCQRVLQCKPFIIEPTPRGGFDEIVYHL